MGASVYDDKVSGNAKENKKLSYCWDSSRYDKISHSCRSADPKRNQIWLYVNLIMRPSAYYVTTLPLPPQEIGCDYFHAVFSQPSQALAYHVVWIESAKLSK